MTQANVGPPELGEPSAKRRNEKNYIAGRAAGPVDFMRKVHGLGNWQGTNFFFVG